MSESNEIRSGVHVNGIPLALMGWQADFGACSWYRLIQPAKALARKHQVQVEVGAGSTLPYTILVAQRTHKIEPIEFLEQIKNARPTIKGREVPKIVYEIDDDLWSVEPTNPAYKYYKENGVLDYAIRAIELSDAVTVSTTPLANIVSKYNPNVYILQNSVSSKYLNEDYFPYRVGSVDKPFVIGWSGSPTHLNDFKQCASSLSTFLKFYPNSRMVFFGNDYTNLLDASVHSQCRQSPWSKTIPAYLDMLSRAQVDVMLAPLSPSTFNESKSNLRLIEANALGIPVIATAWGPYIEDESPGTRYVPVDESWVSALSELESQKMLRLEMSRKGREWVAAGYTQEENVDDWLESYRDILSS